MESIVLYIVMAVCFFGIILLIRNELVHKARIKAIDVASKKSRHIIDNGKTIEEMSKWYDAYKERDAFGSYNKMIFDLRKWKYEHFYPNWIFDENEERNK